VAVATQIALADVIAPEDQDVGLAVWHGWLKSTISFKFASLRGSWPQQERGSCDLKLRF
jgi:hypothetical protein